MRRLLLRLRNIFFGRDRQDEEVTREIKVHLALLEDEYVRRGLTADQARLAARRALGSAAHAADLHRDARTFAWIDDMRRDTVHGLRSLRRTRGFTDGGRPHAGAGHWRQHRDLQRVSAPCCCGRCRIHTPIASCRSIAPPPNVRGGRPCHAQRPRAVPRAISTPLRAGRRTLEHAAGHILTSATLTGQGDAVRLADMQITASVFPVCRDHRSLDVRSKQREEVAGADAVVVLSYTRLGALIQQRIPRSSGASTALDGRGRTVVGVMPLANSPFLTPRPVLDSVCAARPEGRASFSTWRRSPSAQRRLTAGRPRTRSTRSCARPGGRPEGSRSPAAGRARGDGKPALLDAGGRRGPGTADRLRERGEPAARADGRARPRDRRSPCGRRVAGRLIRQLLTESMLLSCIGASRERRLAIGAIRLLHALAASLPRRDLGVPVSRCLGSTRSPSTCPCWPSRSSSPC